MSTSCEFHYDDVTLTSFINMLPKHKNTKKTVAVKTVTTKLHNPGFVAFRDIRPEMEQAYYCKPGACTGQTRQITLNFNIPHFTGATVDQNSQLHGRRKSRDVTDV